MQGVKLQRQQKFYLTLRSVSTVGIKINVGQLFGKIGIFFQNKYLKKFFFST